MTDVDDRSLWEAILIAIVEFRDGLSLQNLVLRIEPQRCPAGRGWNDRAQIQWPNRCSPRMLHATSRRAGSHGALRG